MWEKSVGQQKDQLKKQYTIKSAQQKQGHDLKTYLRKKVHKRIFCKEIINKFIRKQQKKQKHRKHRTDDRSGNKRIITFVEVDRYTVGIKVED